LVAAGVETFAHVRPDSARLDEWRGRFDEMGAAVDETPWTPEAMQATFARLRPELVFALLGTTRQRTKAGDGDYESVDYGLTVLLIDAAVASALRPRFVYLSSLGAGPSARGAYMQARARAEAHLRASGLPFTIARPSFLIGERDASRPGEAVGAAVTDALLGAVRLFGAKRTADRLRSIRGEALAAGLVRAALDPAAEGQVLDSADLR
ncbi:MAG: NAD(P)H-binding protein, partial [Myxococcales bacterium]|nr:NAD(P)H-binding protein [Myxococcales bacterium]